MISKAMIVNLDYQTLINGLGERNLVDCLQGEEPPLPRVNELLICFKQRRPVQRSMMKMIRCALMAHRTRRTIQI